MEKLTFTGVLKKKIFQGDAGYTIAAVEDIDNDEERIIVGYLELLEGQAYEFTGELKDHDKYGEQYNIHSYNMKIPKEGEDMINFLSSPSFQNIGKRTAKKIVDAFGQNTMQIIKEDPQQLLDIGISEAHVNTLRMNLTETSGMEDVYKLLTPLGISDYFINEIYRYTKVNKINFPKEFIQNNPYKLSNDIDGFSFAQADKIFLYYNNDLEDDYRLENGICYVIKSICYQTGNTYVNKEELEIGIYKELNLKISNLDEYLQKLIEEHKVVIKDNKIMLTEFYDAEKAIARNITNRMSFLNLGLDENVIIPNINKIEQKNQINYSDMQKQAIINSLKNNISIVTGGPGTGKTTIISAIIKIFEKIKYDDQVIKNIEDKIILCAPTGRAAQRMKEATGYNAKTIHSLLEWDPYQNEFNRDVENPLPQELIIIDEFSMVDIFLAQSIFRAIRPDSLVVIVGDNAQLESVNPGNVLEDLINSQKVPLVHLDLIFRQNEGSSIAQLAKSIDESQKIEVINTKDMSIIERSTQLPDLVKSIIEKSYSAGYNEMDVQVLYPKYSGRNGIDTLNETLLPNKNEEYVTFGDKKFYLHDKVMQLKNNYEKNIYNGDIGKITQIYGNHGGDNFVLEVTFKDKKINFTKKELIDVTHAYAISIHKSQGSEFPVIILPVSKEAQNMLNKKLLYTAITRAKDKLIIIGELDCFMDNLQRVIASRKTNLKELLN